MDKRKSLSLVQIGIACMILSVVGGLTFGVWVFIRNSGYYLIRDKGWDSRIPGTDIKIQTPKTEVERVPVKVLLDGTTKSLRQ